MSIWLSWLVFCSYDQCHNKKKEDEDEEKERDYFYLTAYSQLKWEVRAGTEGRDPEVGFRSHERILLTGLLPLALSAYILTLPRTIRPLFSVASALPHQSLIQKIPPQTHPEDLFKEVILSKEVLSSQMTLTYAVDTILTSVRTIRLMCQVEGRNSSSMTTAMALAVISYQLVLFFYFSIMLLKSTHKWGL